MLLQGCALDFDVVLLGRVGRSIDDMESSDASGSHATPDLDLQRMLNSPSGSGIPACILLNETTLHACGLDNRQKVRSSLT